MLAKYRNYPPKVISLHQTKLLSSFSFSFFATTPYHTHSLACTLTTPSSPHCLTLIPFHQPFLLLFPFGLLYPTTWLTNGHVDILNLICSLSQLTLHFKHINSIIVIESNLETSTPSFSSHTPVVAFRSCRSHLNPDFSSAFCVFDLKDKRQPLVQLKNAFIHVNIPYTYYQSNVNVHAPRQLLICNPEFLRALFSCPAVR